ncbi:uncharacterized protein OCT59_017890 [Rhizophagus irregularis]|uniref:uncharacterized protein n=1 Tax=Rhizophagus irregularis TaxID=588596 RepID=UPI003322B434|nr:hypothetical protein OCT59_017890 [Rhizophagus irregularis]
MDLAKARTFCSHLLKYKNKESPFDQPYTEGIDNPIKWWSTERPELEEDDDETMLEENQGVQRTTDGHIIPNHKVMVWIENTLDLFNPRILSGLENFGEFPEEEEDEINGNVNGNNQDDNEVVGRGILNFNVDDLAEEFEN